MTTTLTTPANLLNFVSGSVTGTDETITLSRLFTHGTVALQVTGTWTGTITFEGSVDGTNFVTIGLFPAATPTASVATTCTANGVWTDFIRGYKAIRGRFSTASSGTPTISIHAATQHV